MKKMNLKIKRVPYSRLTKSEMADYAEKTIDIVDKHEPETVSFKILFDLLYNKQSDLALLRLDYGIDEQRLRANVMKEELNLAISVFKLKVRIAKKNKPKLDLHALEDPIKNFFRYLYKCRNNHEYNQRIKGFIDLTRHSVEVSSAIDDLNLSHEFDTICAGYYKLNNIWEKRVELLSKRPNFTTDLIVSEIKDTANNLFDGIEVAYLVNKLSAAKGDPEPEDKIDIAALIDELNQLTGMVRKSINLRDLHNKRKREGKPVTDLPAYRSFAQNPYEPTTEDKNEDETGEIAAIDFEDE